MDGWEGGGGLGGGWVVVVMGAEGRRGEEEGRGCYGGGEREAGTAKTEGDTAAMGIAKKKKKKSLQGTKIPQRHNKTPYARREKALLLLPGRGPVWEQRGARREGKSQTVTPQTRYRRAPTLPYTHHTTPHPPLHPPTPSELAARSQSSR